MEFALQRGQEPAAVLSGQGSICPFYVLRLGGLLCPCDESSFADRNSQFLRTEKLWVDWWP